MLILVALYLLGQWWFVVPAPMLMAVTYDDTCGLQAQLNRALEGDVLTIANGRYTYRKDCDSLVKFTLANPGRRVITFFCRKAPDLSHGDIRQRCRAARCRENILHISARYHIFAHMSIATKTLKLPFLKLNRAKADEFARLQLLNTSVANGILLLPKPDRRALTSKAFAHVEIGSAWINQTIRNASARALAKQFRCLPLETNNQNWTLHKVGETYSVSFGLLRGIKKRVPLAVHYASHHRWLDAVLNGTAKAGSIKLWCSRTGIWYACLSVSMEVPDAEPTDRWIGIDRGQNVPIAAATPTGPIIFWHERRIRHIRRVYADRRRKLQAAGKHRAVKKLERRERRMITHINHCLSKEVIALAQRAAAGIRLEDLSGIRQRSRQRHATKTDAGQNRDYWPFFQLEQFIIYKAQLAGIVIEKVPAAYTSKSCHHCGALGTRKKHSFLCQRCHYHAHADANAAMNIRDWFGWCCPLVLEAPVDGAHGMPLNMVQKSAGA